MLPGWRVCSAVVHGSWSKRANAGKIKTTPAFQPGSGAVAQLGERLVRNEEATGSIPVSSTIVSTTCAAFLKMLSTIVPFYWNAHP